MITCHGYDTIEIVCLFHYPIQLTMKNGECITGVALDTARNEARQECIKVQQQEVVCWVILDNITRLTVCVDNPHVKHFNFG